VNGLDSRWRRRIRSSHRDALKRHGYHPNALRWSSREIQERRFEILREAGLKPGQSLLDVGCGFGDLAIWLEERGCPLDYTGLDITPELLEEGRRRHPRLRLLEGEIFDLDPAPRSFDWVMLSGALNDDLGDGGEHARRVIRRMFESCRLGIAFNLLDARHPGTAGRWDLQSFHPEEMRAFVEGFAFRVQLRDDYLENDFTVLAWREPGA